MAKKTFNELLDIDNDDKKIFGLIKEDPRISEAEIAKIIEKSNDAVGVRILNLERRGILKYSAGLNLKNAKLPLVQVSVLTKNADEFIKRVKSCPYLVNLFRISGEFNVTSMITAPELKTIEKIVDICFRRDPNVIKVNTNFVIETVHDYVVPTDFSVEKFSEDHCSVKGCLINQISELSSLGNILVVGLSKVGKTSYLNSLNKNVFDHNVKPTLGIQITKVILERYQVNAYDVGGQIKLNTLYKRVLTPPNGIIYMVDLTFNDKRKEEAKKLLTDIVNHYFSEKEGKKQDIPFMIIGNKMDLVEKIDEKSILNWMELDKYDIDFDIFITSALQNTNVFSSFGSIVQNLLSKGKLE